MLQGWREYAAALLGVRFVTALWYPIREARYALGIIAPSGRGVLGAPASVRYGRTGLRPAPRGRVVVGAMDRFLLTAEEREAADSQLGITGKSHFLGNSKKYSTRSCQITEIGNDILYTLLHITGFQK